MIANYYAKAARRAGVPEMWIEDAVQDMALQAWLAGAESPTSVFRDAIDAARRYGPRSRRGTARLHVDLDAASVERRQPAHDPYATLDTALDTMAALRSLTGRQWRALRLSVNCRPMTELESAHAYRARRRLRRLAA